MLQNCHLYLVFGAHAKEQEDLRGRPAPTRDLGPRSSFDSAHLDVPPDEFPVYLLQNGVKMINEPPKALPRLLRSYSNLHGVRFLFILRYDLYTMQL